MIGTKVRVGTYKYRLNQQTLIKVDEHHDGYSDDIYGRIVDGIKKASLVVADLSYGNRNVHYEIGLA